MLLLLFSFTLSMCLSIPISSLLMCLSNERKGSFKSIVLKFWTPHLTASVSLGSLIEMQIFKLHPRPTTTTTKSLQSCPTLCDPRPTESKFWVWGLAACVLTRLPRETDARWNSRPTSQVMDLGMRKASCTSLFSKNTCKIFGALLFWIVYLKAFGKLYAFIAYACNCLSLPFSKSTWTK